MLPITMQTFSFLKVLIISVIIIFIIFNTFAVTLRCDGSVYTVLCRNAFEDAEPVPETRCSQIIEPAQQVLQRSQLHTVRKGAGAQPHMV